MVHFVATKPTNYCNIAGFILSFCIANFVIRKRIVNRDLICTYKVGEDNVVNLHLMLLAARWICTLFFLENGESSPKKIFEGVNLHLNFYEVM